MHPDILNQNQKDLLPLLAKFNKEFYMVGGTAIALHIGHRQSIDFDLFKIGIIKPKSILKKFDAAKEKYIITLNTDGQLNLICKEVKFTFLDYEFSIKPTVAVNNYIKIPSLPDLAAMKAYALGRRSKWKDYVDLYFILKHHYSFTEICHTASIIYGDLFSAKLFLGQLNYFAGIDYTESIEFKQGYEVDEEEIKYFLNETALREF